MRERTDPRQYPADEDGGDDRGVRATVAAKIAAGALDRGAPHAALAAAREAARGALLALGPVRHRHTNDDLRFLTALAATPPEDLAGCSGEREAILRRALSVLARMLPPASGAGAVAGAPDLAAQDGDASVRSKPRVLVVEDEWLIAADISECLEEAGVGVLGPVGTVDGALRLVEAAATDGGITAAILDVNLGGAAVAPVADALAAIRVPCLYVTGYPADHVRSRTGTAEVLVKPVHHPDLLRAVRTLAAEGKHPSPVAA